LLRRKPRHGCNPTLGVAWLEASQTMPYPTLNSAATLTFLRSGTREQLLDELHLHEALRTPRYGLDNRLQNVDDTRSHEGVDEVRPTPEQSHPHAPLPATGTSSASGRGSSQKKHMQRPLRVLEGQCASACSSMEQMSSLRGHGAHTLGEPPLSRSTQGNSVVISGTGRRGPQHPRRSGLVNESTGARGSWKESAQCRRPSRWTKEDLDMAMTAAVAGVRSLSTQLFSHT
jgi:hypothetical protein